MKKIFRKKPAKKRVKARTSVKHRIRTRAIGDGKFRFTEKGLKMIREHPFVYQVVNEIVLMDSLGLNLLDPKVKTKRSQNHEIIKVASGFKRQRNLFDSQAPFFRVTDKLNFGKYVVERVRPEHGAVSKAIYRVTSSSGESVLVKIQPQQYVTSSIENLETARHLGFRTPKYFLEFDFPKFNVQVLETMKLPNMRQLRKSNPIIYFRIKKEFRKEAKELGKTFYDAEETNCLVLIRKRKFGRIKPYFYWIDLF